MVNTPEQNKIFPQQKIKRKEELSQKKKKGISVFRIYFLVSLNTNWKKSLQKKTPAFPHLTDSTFSFTLFQANSKDNKELTLRLISIQCLLWCF